MSKSPLKLTKTVVHLRFCLLSAIGLVILFLAVVISQSSPLPPPTAQRLESAKTDSANPQSFHENSDRVARYLNNGFCSYSPGDLPEFWPECCAVSDLVYTGGGNCGPPSPHLYTPPPPTPAQTCASNGGQWIGGACVYPPRVTGVSANPLPAHPYLKQADRVTIRVAFSKDVTLDSTDGLPTLSLNITDAEATYSSQPEDDSSYLDFEYTVGAGDNTPQRDINDASSFLDAVSFKLNGAVISDDSDNDLATTDGQVSLSSLTSANRLAASELTVDTTPPTITVTPSSDDSSPKKKITVSATATDEGSGIKPNSLSYNLIEAADSCDSTEMTSGTSRLRSVTLSSESDNGKKVCFQAEDLAGNKAYQASGVITGIDSTPPTIIVTPASDDATAKTTITVSASSTDTDLEATPIWLHKVIDEADTCNQSEMLTDLYRGNSITLNTEADNGKKVCFWVEDQVGNNAYQASGVITGIDSTPPTITVTPARNHPIITHEVTISATATDQGSGIKAGSLSFQVIDRDTSCSAAVMTAPTTGSSIIFNDESYNGKKVCFQVEDQAGHKAYQASGVITGIDTVPPTITVTPSSDDSSPKQSMDISAQAQDNLAGVGIKSGSLVYKVIDGADTCGESEMATGTTKGNSVTLNSESDNNHKVCFRVEDHANHKGYQASGIITGIDRTPPTINVSAVTNNQVSATVTDTHDNNPTFAYQILASGNCDASTGGSFTSYPSGTQLSLSVGQFACFKATDAASNTAYAASGTGTAVMALSDTTPPTIIVTPSSDDSDPKTAITVSATSSASDLGANPAWSHKLIDADDSCDSSQMSSGTSSGNSVILHSEADNSKKVCFSVSDTNANPGYGVSGLITGIDTTAPDHTITYSTTPSGGNYRSPKTTVTVSATATDQGSGIKSGSWLYKLIDATDSCDSAEMATATTSGNSLTLSSEADNSKKVCFQVEDNLAHITYAPSGVISGLDRTPPTITVTPASDDASPKTAITVSASSTDPDLGATPAWIHKVISDSDTCDSTEMTSGTSSGQSVTLNSEAHNHHRVCFSVEDNLGNKAYQASGVITGLDRTDPVINVSSVINNQVSASVTETFLASFGVQQLTSGSCSSSTPGSFSNYHSGDTLTLVDGETACFKATDTAGNTSYEASSSGLDITPPTIIVTPASDDASPKTAITVSASSTDPDLGATPAWIHKVISDSDTCDSTEMTSDSSSGNSISLNAEAHNHHKVCFSVSDTNSNPGYGVSGTISGLDTTPPTITVTPNPTSTDYSDPRLIYMPISASTTDEGSGIKEGSLVFKLIEGADTCDESEMSSGLDRENIYSNPYTVRINGDNSNGKKVCFGVEDNVGHRVYAASGIITGIDSTRPVINVTPASDDSSSKTTITVSASATDFSALGNLPNFDDYGWDEIRRRGSGIKEGSLVFKLIEGADTCDESEMSSGTSSGSSITLNTEADNGKKVCFSVEDNVGLQSYAASGIITGIDTTAPTIIVIPTSDDSSSKTEITVSATATDEGSGLKSGSLIYKVISATASCDSTQMASGTTVGESLTLNTEADNSKKVCFVVEDEVGHKAYQASGVITGIDRTSPTITVTPASDDSTPKTEIVVSASSTDTDLGANPTWIHKVIGSSDSCDLTQMSSGTSSGQSITLNSEDHNNHRVCFSVSDTNANPGYGVSGLISGLDTTPPTITVTISTIPSGGDYSSLKREITVSASSSDSDLVPSSWLRWSTNLTIDACDEGRSPDIYPNYSGNSLTLSSTTDNSKKVCFQVDDLAGNRAYQASGIITGIDRIAPTITVTPSREDLREISAPKREIEITASATDRVDLNSPVVQVNDIVYKVVDGSYTACDDTYHGTLWDDTGMNSGTTAGSSVHFNTEEHNGKKVCFRATDTAGNISHATSGVITGLDRTDPVINVSSVTNNQVSASVTETFLASFGVQQLTSGSCSSSTPGSFSNYHSGDTLTLVDGETACFKATDTAGNTSYEASSSGLDITPPTIIVTPASDDSNPKTAITVSASSTDPDLGATPTWIHKVISDSDTCDSTEMTSGTSSGQSVTLNSEAHNHHKVCFSVSDTNANPGYGVSGTISGLDTTPPTITVTPASDDSDPKTAITVSATATDQGSGIKSGSWLYKVIDGADSCDSTEMATATTSGNSLTLSSEADNSKKVCFQVEDNLAHITYAPSGVISGLDRTPPTITVTPASDDASPKTAITVSASSTDPDLGATPAWIHKVISDSDTCDSTEMTSGTSSGQSVTLNSEAHNHHRVCFSVEDNLGNKAYQASGLITGLDRTDPVINVSSVINNQVSASVTETFLASFGVQQLTSGSCSSSTPGSFSNYHSGDTLTLVDGETACFKATDTAGNTAYAASTVGTDITPPTIIVTPASDDASPKTAITVSASSTDPDLGATPAWIHKVISDSDTCDSTEMTSGTSSGQSVTLNSEAHNHHKVCFSVSDTNANPGYGVSGTISGLDTTPPTITVTPASDDSDPKTAITVSATATDQGSGIKSGSWLYKVIDGADSCDSTEMATATTSGNSLTLSSEADNSKKVCFQVEDNLAHITYAPSGVISGLDRTPPTIIVTPASDDASPKTAITVSASSTDPDLGATPAWIHKVISDSDTCDSTEMTSDSSSGNSITLNSEAHNHHKVCFSVEDNLGNKAYQASGVITGLDRTDPVINVSSVINNQVSASVTETFLASFGVQQLTSGSCSSSTPGSFSNYHSGDTLTLVDGETACFKATDTAGNTSYEASSSGLDITPPTIIVTPASDDASPKTAITVSASSTDPDLGATPAWIHKVISDSDTCDSTQMTSGTSSGQSVTLNSEAHNHHKVCFSVSDTNANPGYGVSGTISGLDTTPPTITVTPASDDSTAKTTITVSATATDGGSGIKSGSWLYKVIDGADSCDSTEMATATTSGNSLTLSSEADNSKKVCFGVEDNLAHITYAPSGVISGLDRTPPTITVTPASDDASPKTAITVSASSTDPDLGATPAWIHKVISDSDTCDSTEMSSDSSSGNSISLNSESDNSKKVCFSVEDNLGNKAYQASGVITGIDRTDPVIDVGAVSSGSVSATVTDNSGTLSSFQATILTSGNCDSSTTTFTDYSSGNSLTLAEGETACFKATDTAGNTAYAASTVGTDITPPTIIVTPASDDSTAKTAITVSASSTDPDLGATPAWIHKVISDSDTCDSTQMTSGTSSGQSVTLNSEDHNNHRVCFSVSDTNANPGYGVSGTISGLDTTPPTITVTPASDDSTAKTTITVSATATDQGSGIKSGSWLYKVIDGADSCDSTEMATATTSGNSLTLSSEADNSKKVCFGVEDNLAHITYAPSGVISGLDRTPPTITVTPASDDASPKTAITVSASSTDPDLGATPAWIHKVISDSDTCDSSQMTSDSSSGNSITLNSEAHNHHKVCFSVEDNLGNKAYQASGVITGLDRTDPVINVSSVINNQVSASVTETFLASFGVQQLTSGSCSSSTPGSFSNYHSGDTLTLVDGETACFKATDTAGNTSYEASSSGLDITPPTITVTPASDDASPKTAITVSASSTDPDLGATPAWIHKVISDSDTCDSTEMSSDSSSGNSITLNSEAHNHHKVCFQVEDQATNKGYAESGTISGLDTTPPTITVTPASDDSTAKTTITVSATATDGGSGIKSGSWLYKVIDGADSCDSTEMTSGTSSGNSITLSSEADNSKKVCFQVEDNLAHITYAPSGVISGLDRTPPTIIVTPASDDASPKTAITVSASSTDPDLGATPAWIHKVISDSDTCDSTEMSSDSSSGNSITLNSEAHNNHRVCFSVSDTNTNPGYGVSGTISGLDTTPPTITVTPASDDSDPKTAITVSATATDQGSGIKSGSWLYKVIDGADSCDSTEMATATTSGNSLTLSSEADNSKKVCFQVEDNLAHITYAPSGVISGLDRTPPTITVTPASDDASPKTAITVSASSTDPDLGATPAWIHKVISDSDTCDSTEMSSDSSSGNSITLNSEAHNHHKVCFSVEDNLGNKAYQASGVITGLDRTDPVINVSSVINNQVSASVTETFLASFGVQQLTSGSCSSSTPGSFSNYHSGDTLTLVDGETACFKATDTAGNTSYEASSSGLDRTPPTIIVTPASDDASPKTAITVSASSTDPDLGATPTWIHKVISDSDTCDSTEMTSGTSSGQSVTLNSEAHNHHKVCFSVSDTNSNPGYGVSGLISGLDTTPPTITVTPASDDSDPKTAITVSATATDGGSGIKSGSWLYKVIDGADSCDSTEMATATTSGSRIDLNTEAQNNHRVCFQVEDNLAHVTYATSGVISGLDRTDPVINVSSVVNNQLSATVSDNLDDNPSFTYQLLSSGNCDSTTEGSFATYNPGSKLTLSLAQTACFKALDVAGNVTYAASSSGTDPTASVGTSGGSSRGLSGISSNLKDISALVGVSLLGAIFFLLFFIHHKKEQEQSHHLST